MNKNIQDIKCTCETWKFKKKYSFHVLCVKLINIALITTIDHAMSNFSLACTTIGILRGYAIFEPCN